MKDLFALLLANWGRIGAALVTGSTIYGTTHNWKAALFAAATAAINWHAPAPEYKELEG